MKVLLIGHSYLAEENQKQLTSLSQHVTVEVASPRTSRGMIFNYDVAENAILGQGWRIRLYDKLVPPKFPEAAYIFKSLTLGLRKFQPDVVHIEGDPFTPFFLQSFLYARLWSAQAKIVCTVKQNTYTSRGMLGDAIKDFVTRQLVPHVDRFITVNRGVAEIYRDRFGADPERMTYCTHLGVDTELFSPWDDVARKKSLSHFSLERGAALIGYCGRLVDYKGVSDLVTAVELLRSRSQRDYRLALLGDGPMREELAARARHTPWLYLLPPIPHAEVAQFLKGLDLFVMPPRILPWHVEHDAHALLEAMATGLPCIATRCGAIEDVLPGVGVLVDPEQPESLSDAIGELLVDNERASRLGKDGCTRITEEYSLKSVAEAYLHVYRQVLG
ncbi:MAG: hypothetical protein CVU69_02355 [Deltaproteobacteria bacterium HGW-Deltaproteobacteria-4]|nr:MAG: hypothetical protein CVU69_02355 [Deltaproteobacteria bacterium HGW-Deltaproteobacteria-4]